MDRRSHDNDAGRMLRDQRCDGERRVERVAHIDRFEELGRLLDKANQLVTDHVRKAARAGRTESEYLKAVCKQIAMSMRAAEFDIVVNRMIVSRDHLKSGEVRVRYRAARVAKHLTYLEVVERSPLRHAKLLWIEVCHAAALFS